MNRRQFVLALGATLASGHQAVAKNFSDGIVRNLEKDGYRVISITRTLLGRTRIRAVRGNTEREIVLNSATGEILRDLQLERSETEHEQDSDAKDTSEDSGGQDDGGGDDGDNSGSGSGGDDGNSGSDSDGGSDGDGGGDDD